MYEINGITVTKELVQSIISVGTIESFHQLLNALEIPWSDEGGAWREFREILKDLNALYPSLPSEGN